MTMMSKRPPLKKQKKTPKNKTNKQRKKTTTNKPNYNNQKKKKRKEKEKKRAVTSFFVVDTKEHRRLYYMFCVFRVKTNIPSVLDDFQYPLFVCIIMHSFLPSSPYYLHNTAALTSNTRTSIHTHEPHQISTVDQVGINYEE